MAISNLMRMKIIYADQIISHTKYDPGSQFAKDLKKQLLKMSVFALGVVAGATKKK